MRDPTRVFQLAGHLRHLGGCSTRSKAQHQRTRKRPWLRAQIAAVLHKHAGFLEHLARHRLLQRFAGFDEAGNHRIPPRRPTCLPPQQHALAIADRHDDGRIHARVMLGPTLRAVRDETGTPEGDRPATHAAKPRARLPMQHRARIGVGSGDVGRPIGGGLPQIDALRRLHAALIGRQAKPADVIAQAQKNRRLRPFAERRALHQQGLTLRVGERSALGIEQQDAALRPQTRQCIGIVTQQIATIERRVGEGTFGG